MKVLRKQRRDASLRRQSQNLRPPSTCFLRDPFHRLPFSVLSPRANQNFFVVNLFTLTIKYRIQWAKSIERTTHNFYYTV